MRGKDDRSEILFSYIRLDERIPADGFRVALEARV